MKDKIKVELNTGTLFFEMMFLMFLGLKISGLIDWSWWWVFAPVWVPVVIVVLGVGILFIAAVVINRLQKKEMKK